jgi:hypothetical protein
VRRAAVLAASMGALIACASTPGAEGEQTNAARETRISENMQRLGATEKRGACYAERLAATLDANGQAEAERVVEGASSKDEMREGVLKSSLPVRRAFIRASMWC